MLGRFVADAAIAHVQKGLAMAEKGDADGACALFGQMTSAETQAEWDRIASIRESHGTMRLAGWARQRVPPTGLR